VRYSVLHLDLAKQALLARILAQFVE